jgi:phospholipase C
MITADRRKFLQLLGAGAFAASLRPSIARALAIPARSTTGTIADVKHIVVLMQENRSFDHYFGTLNGVRGFGDPRAVTLPSGNPAWYQPTQGSYELPFHPTAADLGLQFMEDLPHDWTTTHDAWNGGNWDQWVPSKGTPTMAYLTRDDIPFHYALADAFTICDAYHCSLLGPTDPNRLHLWSGWVGNNGANGGPAVDNSGTAYSWTTYPEQLQAAGVSWKVYQDIGYGLNAANYFGWAITDPLIGNFGDNPLTYFTQYQNAATNSPLAEYGLTGTDVAVSGGLFDEFAADIANNVLPQVSWVVAPEAFSEHPNWPANYGAYYVSQILDALTANPAVWSSTVLLVLYDENDGFFDHVVAPTPPTSRATGLCTPDADPSLELFPGNSSYAAGPFGLGVRVPLLAISPWSKGGYVNSQVFDHTSVLRFIQQVFGPSNPILADTNITPWRQVVTGDLTSCFNFATPNATIVSLPDTSGYVPPNGNRQSSYIPTPPTTQTMAVQETGSRPARALPYDLHVQAAIFAEGSGKEPGAYFLFENPGTAGAVFQVRDGTLIKPPRSYTVGPGKTLADSWSDRATNYDLAVYGPNGFLRHLKGGLNATSANVWVRAAYNAATLELRSFLTNHGATSVQITATNRYTGQAVTKTIAAGATLTTIWKLSATGGWYDITIAAAEDSAYGYRLSGHIENGQDSVTDPGIGTNT